MNRAASARAHPWRVAVMLPFTLVFIFVVSAFLAVVAASALSGGEGVMAALLEDKGPDRLMRRIMMVLAIPFIPVLLKEAGWRGWRDCGLSRTVQAGVDPGWRRDLLAGVLIGLASLGLMMGIAMAAGVREFGRDEGWWMFMATMFGVAFQASVIGLVEEIAVRGILFRSLARLWSFWPAAMVSSVLFSYAHFLSASPEAFGSGGVWEQTGAVLASALSAPGQTPAIGMRLANLSLMGLVLCIFVYRTKTVWMAVGAHAGWVWLIRLNAKLLDKTRAGEGSLWLGNRPDTTDSLLTVMLFLGLAAYGYWGVPMRGGEEAGGPADE